jgi:hypothetical protein
MELSGAGDSPGNGQHQVIRVLHEQKKLLSGADEPDAPGYVVQQVGLRNRGEMTTAQLELEYRRAPKLSILLHQTPLNECIRRGITQNVFIYREGTQVYGPGDPSPVIHIADSCFLHTMADAKAKQLWPRAEALGVSFRANPTTVDPGQSAMLEVVIEGGIPPFTIASSESLLNASGSQDRSHVVRVSPSQSMSYSVEVTNTSVIVRTAIGGSGVLPLPPPPPAPKPSEEKLPSEVMAQGALPQALDELWQAARKAKFPGVSQISIKVYGIDVASKLHQAMATISGAEIKCEFDVGIESEGVDEFAVIWKGRFDKAHGLKGFLDGQIRNASDSKFDAIYKIAFSSPLSLTDESTEQLRKKLTQYGGGEAYVEAKAGKV